MASYKPTIAKATTKRRFGKRGWYPGRDAKPPVQPRFRLGGATQTIKAAALNQAEEAEARKRFRVMTGAGKVVEL